MCVRARRLLSGTLGTTGAAGALTSCLCSDNTGVAFLYFTPSSSSRWESSPHNINLTSELQISSWCCCCCCCCCRRDRRCTKSSFSLVSTLWKGIMKCFSWVQSSKRDFSYNNSAVSGRDDSGLLLSQYASSPSVLGWIKMLQTINVRFNQLLCFCRYIFQFTDLKRKCCFLMSGMS